MYSLPVYMVAEVLGIDEEIFQENFDFFGEDNMQGTLIIFIEELCSITTQGFVILSVADKTSVIADTTTVIFSEDK